MLTSRYTGLGRKDGDANMRGVVRGSYERQEAGGEAKRQECANPTLQKSRIGSICERQIQSRVPFREG